MSQLSQPNSTEVGVTRFLVCYPPHPPPPPHQTNSVLLLFKSAVSRELELNTDKSFKIEFGRIFLTHIFFRAKFFFTQKNFRPKFFPDPKTFRPKFFNPDCFSTQFSGPNLVSPKKFLTQIFLTLQNFHPKFCLTKKMK